MANIVNHIDKAKKKLFMAISLFHLMFSSIVPAFAADVAGSKIAKGTENSFRMLLPGL